MGLLEWGGPASELSADRITRDLVRSDGGRGTETARVVQMEKSLYQTHHGGALTCTDSDEQIPANRRGHGHVTTAAAGSSECREKPIFFSASVVICFYNTVD